MIQVTRYTFVRHAHTEEEQNLATLLLNSMLNIFSDARKWARVPNPWFVDKIALNASNRTLQNAIKSWDAANSTTLHNAIGNGATTCNPENDELMRSCVAQFLNCFKQGRSKKFHMWEESPDLSYALSLTIGNETAPAVLGEFIRAGTPDTASTKWVQDILVQWKQLKIIDTWEHPSSGAS